MRGHWVRRRDLRDHRKCGRSPFIADGRGGGRAGGAGSLGGGRERRRRRRGCGRVLALVVVVVVVFFGHVVLRAVQRQVDHLHLLATASPAVSRGRGPLLCRRRPAGAWKGGGGAVYCCWPPEGGRTKCPPGTPVHFEQNLWLKQMKLGLVKRDRLGILRTYNSLFAMINSLPGNVRGSSEDDIQLPKRFFQLKQLLKVWPDKATQARAKPALFMCRGSSTWEHFKKQIYQRDCFKR